MIQVINLENGKELKLSSSAAFLLVYKQQFKREPLQDIMAISRQMKAEEKESEEKESEIDSSELLEKMDLELIYNLAWALAKTANYSKVADPISFFIENGEFRPLEHIDTIVSMALKSITPDFDLKIEGETEEKN